MKALGILMYLCRIAIVLTITGALYVILFNGGEGQAARAAIWAIMCTIAITFILGITGWINYEYVKDDGNDDGAYISGGPNPSPPPPSSCPGGLEIQYKMARLAEARENRMRITENGKDCGYWEGKW